MAQSRKNKKKPSIEIQALGPRYALLFSFAAGFLFLLTQILMVSQVYHEGGTYFKDPDSYTWLDRATQVMEGERFYVYEDPRDNFPHGFRSHWTQLFHWTLALFSGCLSLFCDKQWALEQVGVWICPVLGALLLGVLIHWMLKRWPWPLALIAAFVFLVNPFQMWTFSIGRPDHQCLLFLFLMISTLLFFDQKMRLSALFMGLGVWISIQALSIWGIFLGALVLRISLPDKEKLTEHRKQALEWTGFSAGFTLIFCLLEGDPFAIFPDSISLCHVILMAGPFLGLLAVNRLKPGFLKTVSIPALLTLGGAFWIYHLQTTSHDPHIQETMARWFSTNLEFLPGLFSVNGDYVFGRLHQSLAYTLYALPILLYGLYKSPLLGFRAKWVLGVGVTAGALLSLWQMRWRDMNALFMALFLGLALYQLIHKNKKQGLIGILGLGASCLLLWPFIHSTYQTFQIKKPEAEYLILKEVSQWIQENDPCDGEASVLCSWDQGPMVRYWSGWPVIAGPYHRNMQGILDTMNAYTSRTPDEFNEIADKRKVKYLIRPPMSNPNYDLYNFEWVAGKKHPAIWVRTQAPTSDGMGIYRGYDLSPGMTPDRVNTILRLRLENNAWKGWPGLKGVQVPGLEKHVQDGDLFPFLFLRVPK